MASSERTIGQLAKAADVGVETIRFYERRGLLKQPKKPADGGFRRYNEDALRLLRYIRLAQDFGLSLRNIEDLLRRTEDAKLSFCQAVRETMENKLAGVRQELAGLHALEAELQTFLMDCSTRDPNLPCPILVGLGHPPEGARTHLTAT